MGIPSPRVAGTTRIGIRGLGDGMDRTGPDDEADARPALQRRLGIAHAKDDLLGPVVVEQPTTGAGGRHEVGGSLSIVGPIPGHPARLSESGLSLKLRVAARPRTTSCPGHPHGFTGSTSFMASSGSCWVSQSSAPDKA